VTSETTGQSKSPLDNIGHGTHTASTAAGSAATDAAFYKYGKGTAVGVAPGARIASYKACWQTGCASSDVLAAFDEAIADGVDVISISVGDNRKPQKFHKDSVAVGALRVIRKGIVVSASAGNTGPAESTVTNVAPWLLTTGASTINRRFPDTVVLGNGETFTGTSLYAGSPVSATEIPLVYGGNVGSRFCEAGKLNSTMVAAKIVLCDYGINGGVAKGEAVKLAGGAGAILAGVKDFGEFAYANPHMFPTTVITFASTEKIMKYLSTAASPVTTVVFHGTVDGRIPTSPRIAAFSSRGSNRRAPEILKPDVIAPGVNILAARTGESSPTGLGTDRRRVQYNIISGTSMSCPHVSGVAALLRQARPDWSPAAIKSALMTTAYVLDNAGNVIKDMSTGKASTPFARGSGHVDPNRPLDLGLVYDADADDYVSFLCALGYTADQIAVFTDDDPETDCLTHTGSAGDLNYPAFSAVFNPNMDNVTQRRTMRNVGCNFRATYTANITSPAGVRVTVKPRKLRFDARQRRRDYEIAFFTPQGAGNLTDKYTFGSIVWSDGEHRVTSPIAITWPWPAPQVAAM
jgi:subtilisin family serine protease